MTNNLLQFHTSVEGQKIWIELMNMKWSSYDDFEKKYGSDNNPEFFAKRYSLTYMYDGIGYLLKEKQIDIDTAYQLGSLAFVFYWKKTESYMRESRRCYGHHQGENLDYLAREIIKYAERIGKPILVPENFTRYVSDE